MSADSPPGAALDRLECIDVVHSFCGHLDHRRFDELAALFSDRGIFRMGPSEAAGPMAIRAMFDAAGSSVAESRHVPTNHVVSFDGDHARVEVVMTVWDLPTSGPPQPALMADARFELERAGPGGSWAIALHDNVVLAARSR